MNESMDEGMDASYGADMPMKPPRSESESVDEENAGANEILISKDKLPEGCKPGDEYTFRVVEDYGDEASLELVGESDEGMEEDEPMSTEGRELAALSEEGE